MERGATFSPCRTYRYSLLRQWEPDKGRVLFIGLNPSTADETQDDPTIRRCVGYAKAWGYGGICMANLFAYRATDPRDMKAAADPIGPDTDWSLGVLASEAGLVVAAWGAHGCYLGRGEKVRRMLSPLHYLRLTKDGSPGHPLYLPACLTPQVWA